MAFMQNAMDYSSGWYYNNAPPGQVYGVYTQPTPETETETAQNNADTTSEKSERLRKERLLKCNNLYDKNEIYLFQFLIDNVVITNENPLLREKDRTAPLTALIKFIDFPCFEVKYGETVAEEGYAGQQIVKGITCLFSKTALQLVNSLMRNPLAVNLYRIVSDRYVSDPSSKVGHVNIDMEDDFTATVLRNTEEAASLPVGAAVMKTYQLHNTLNQPTADITVYISLSCFGKVALTQFWLSDTTENRYKYIPTTKTEQEVRKRFDEINEEECRLQPVIADFENITGFKNGEDKEDICSYKKKTYEWEKLIKECGCYAATEPLGNDVCACVGKCNCKQLAAELFSKRRQPSCPFGKDVCVCIGKCVCKLPDSVQPHFKELTRNTAVSGQQQPLCSFNKNVCICVGKCNCKLPETTQPLLKERISDATYRPDKDNICPFNKDICKCSGKCLCEISETMKRFTEQDRQTARLRYCNKTKQPSYDSLMPQPQWSKPPFIMDEAELNYRFTTKDGMNTNNNQPTSNVSPCPFKVDCPFC